MTQDNKERRQDYPQIIEDISETKRMVSDIHFLLNGDLAKGGINPGLVSEHKENTKWIAGIKGAVKTSGIAALCTVVTGVITWILVRIGIGKQ